MKLSKIKYVGINNKKVNGIFIEELIKEESVIIKHSDLYDHDEYGLDIDIEIYNDMRE